MPLGHAAGLALYFATRLERVWWMIFGLGLLAADDDLVWVWGWWVSERAADVAISEFGHGCSLGRVTH
jgi:hypothetical protein